MNEEFLSVAAAIAFVGNAFGSLPEKTVGQLQDAHRVCEELGSVVERLEAKNQGQYSRMQYEVIRWCLDGMEKEELPKGYTNRVIREARQLTRIARPALERAKRILADEETDLAVPRFHSGSPVRAVGPLLIGDRTWPDGRVEKDAPLVLNGWGHFSRVRRELSVLNRMGYNFVQIEEGIYKFMPHKGIVVTNAITNVAAVAKTAWENDTRVAYLFSPHYVPGWIMKELPKDNGKCRNGFMPLCIHDPHVNSIFAGYCGLVAGLAKDMPAIHSFTLSNEPHSGNVSACKSMRKLWTRYLANKYKTVAALNDKWGTAYAAFEDVETYAFPNLMPTPACLEFIRCTRQATSDFHAGLVTAAKKAAPNVPVHSKIVANECFSGRRFETFWSIDPVWFSEHMDYLDHDPMCFHIDSPTSRYAARWIENEAAYDYIRSFADKPVINTENHDIVDRTYGEVPPEHVYATLWQNVIHGQTATALWCWERGLDDKSIMIGLAPEQPDCLESLGRCSLDIQRLSRELAPIMSKRPAVLVMHSLSTEVLGGKCDGKAFMQGYAAASFLGETVGVATDETLARYATDGILRAPYDTARVIVLSSVTHLPRAAIDGLRRLEETGIRVIVFGDAPACDDFGKPLTVKPWKSQGKGDELALHEVLVREMPLWALKARPRACLPGTATPVFGVEARGYETKKGVRRIALCNQLRKPVSVDVGASGRDLITGKRTDRVLEVSSRVPMFIELDSGR